MDITYSWTLDIWIGVYFNENTIFSSDFLLTKILIADTTASENMTKNSAERFEKTNIKTYKTLMADRVNCRRSLDDKKCPGKNVIGILSNRCVKTQQCKSNKFTLPLITSYLLASLCIT